MGKGDEEGRVGLTFCRVASTQIQRQGSGEWRGEGGHRAELILLIVDPKAGSGNTLE